MAAHPAEEDAASLKHKLRKMSMLLMKSQDDAVTECERLRLLCPGVLMSVAS